MRIAVAAVAIVWLSGACGGREPVREPPDVRPGVDECSFCRMIVARLRFAGAIVGDSGRVERFDDVGCLVEFLRQNPRPGGVVWVHGMDRWGRAADSWFVRSRHQQTPMGSGLVAFASRAAAVAAAGRADTVMSDTVMSWDDLLASREPAGVPRPEPAR